MVPKYPTLKKKHSPTVVSIEMRLNESSIEIISAVTLNGRMLITEAPILKCLDAKVSECSNLIAFICNKCRNSVIQ